MFAATEIGATGDFDFEVFYQKVSTPSGDKKDEINPATTDHDTEMKRLIVVFTGFYADYL